jgi:sn-glycerol 3-phosphate transport system ATP-binding protein
VTHDQVEAMTLADRMIVMNAGVADQIGAPLEVYANPATEFVAGFIGSPPTNFLEAGLVGAQGPGRIGIRPEHVRLGESGKLEATVGYAEALGAETLVHLRAADGTQITVRQEAGLPIPEEGQRCALDWDSAQEMRFDAQGLRL